MFEFVSLCLMILSAFGTLRDEKSTIVRIRRLARLVAPGLIDFLPATHERVVFYEVSYIDHIARSCSDIRVQRKPAACK